MTNDVAHRLDVGRHHVADAGADRIVVDGPIVDAADPHDAVMRTLDEIDKATSLSRG